METQLTSLLVDDARRLLELISADYFGIRQTYYEAIKQAVVSFLVNTGSRVTAFQSDARQAMTEAFPPAFAAGISDGGGDPDNMDPEDDAWLTAKMNAEMGFIGVTFQNLRQIKIPGDLSASDIDEQGDQTATAYANTLDGVYNEGRLRGLGNQMLTFAGDDGKESCDTCQKLKGERHRASWWVSHDLVPGVPGNTNFKCGGWNCAHWLENDKGEVQTI
jgi:hypothetical protein